jgi:hypothetical protein
VQVSAKFKYYFINIALKLFIETMNKIRNITNLPSQSESYESNDRYNVIKEGFSKNNA